MDAPAPRTADGKPDLSGNWLRADQEPLPSELAGLFKQQDRVNAGGDVVGEPQVPTFAPDPKSPPLGAFWDIATNFPGGLPLTPWAAALKKERMASDMKDNPDANCMPMGITQFHMQPQPRKIIQTPKLIVILYEANYGLRYIYTDGRPLPPQGEPQPWWYGYSVGRWEGDTLVVETNNLRGAEESPVRRLARCARDAVQRSGEVHRALPPSDLRQARDRRDGRGPEGARQSRSQCASISADGGRGADRVRLQREPAVPTERSRVD